MASRIVEPAASAEPATSGEPPASAVPATSSDPAANAAGDLAELAVLLGETLACLKRSGPPPTDIRGAFERYSLGPRHFPALIAVMLSGPLSVSELARRLGHTLPTTSTIVGQLSRAGLLDRAEDENDRRRTIVRVHDEHAEQITAWAQQTLAPLRITLARLAPQAREHFMAGWRILHEEATRASAGAKPPGQPPSECPEPHERLATPAAAAAADPMLDQPPA